MPLKDENAASIAASVCNKTGIAMSGLAAFAKVHPSLLCRSEKGLRNLPVAASHALVKLYQLANNVKAAPLAALKQMEKDELLNEAYWCRAQCHPLQKKLAIASQKYTQAYTTVQLLNALEAQATQVTEKEKRWVENQRYDAGKKLEKYGLLQQEKLSMAIKLLEYEALLLERAAKVT